VRDLHFDESKVLEGDLQISPGRRLDSVLRFDGHGRPYRLRRIIGRQSVEGSSLLRQSTLQRRVDLLPAERAVVFVVDVHFRRKDRHQDCLKEQSRRFLGQETPRGPQARRLEAETRRGRPCARTTDQRGLHFRLRHRDLRSGRLPGGRGFGRR
jgi:hypothetical protein